MNRLWSQVGVRSASVSLLLVGVVGGVYLGQDREVQQHGVEANLAVQADAAEMDMLKERHAEHAAARAPQRKAEVDAAAKAAQGAKEAAVKARKLERAALKKSADAKRAAAAKKATLSGGGATKPYDGPIPSSCSDYSGNRAIGCALLLKAGFDLDQMPCLDKLWKRESGWNHRAHNSSSGAYGIPQALPGSKMAAFGDDWQTNPKTQILWGLDYIEGRYKTPCGAWSHSQNTGWY